MGSFSGPFKGEKLDGFKWKVLEEFEFTTDNGVVFTVPVNYITNLASIPWFLRWLISRGGTHSQADALHDYLYEHSHVPRKRKDKIYLEAMECLGVKLWKRRTMYRGVRLFGGIHLILTRKKHGD